MEIPWLDTHRVGRVFGRWIRIGREASLLPSEARYVVLTNIIAILGAVFSLGFAPVLVISGAAIYPLLQIVYALGYLPTLWLNHRGHHIAATVWLLLGGHLLVVVQILVEGPEVGVALFFMLHSMLPFLLLPPKHGKLMFAMSALAGIDLMIVTALGTRLPHLGPTIALDRLDLLRPILTGGLFASLAACAYYARRATLIAEERLDLAYERSEELLLNMLPSSIATRLKINGGTIADGFADVTVLFADIVGFTELSARLSPKLVVAMLNELFCEFDDLADQLGLEKIKTIGDCYMVAGGLPEPRSDHAPAVAMMGLGMLRTVRTFSARTGHVIDIRIGIHSGPVVAGVIGKRKFVYDLWGDTVNTASRMESHGKPGAIQISDECRRLLESGFRITPRGAIDVKGKGMMDTWLLDGPVDTSAES